MNNTNTNIKGSYKLKIVHSVYNEEPDNPKKRVYTPEYNQHIVDLKEAVGEGFGWKEVLKEPTVDYTIFSYSDEHGQRLYGMQEQPAEMKPLPPVPTDDQMPESTMLDPQKFSNINEQGVEVYMSPSARKRKQAEERSDKYKKTLSTKTTSPEEKPIVESFYQQKAFVVKKVSKDDLQEHFENLLVLEQKNNERAKGVQNGLKRW